MQGGRYQYGVGKQCHQQQKMQLHAASSPEKPASLMTGYPYHLPFHYGAQPTAPLQCFAKTCTPSTSVQDRPALFHYVLYSLPTIP